MKSSCVLQLHGWVKSQRSWILQNTPKMSEIRDKAEAELGFKCPTGSIADCMDAENIPRRMSKDAAKLQGLSEERDKYRSCLYKLIMITSVGPEMAQTFREVLAFDEELSSLLDNKQAG